MTKHDIEMMLRMMAVGGLIALLGVFIGALITFSIMT
tara:strand:+ start:201 stop:311 length:111 start_codon:yes stop_codon:yes gene_type:complete